MALPLKVDVELGARGYPVIVSPGAFEGLGPALAARLRPGRCVVVTDDTVGPLWAGALEDAVAASGFSASRLEFPAGEANKTVETWGRVLDGALALGVDRKTPLVALGGGVVGDVAGFAAASLLRGVPFVQVPTTLLAMVDSSVGGKTGVNHPQGKNLVGAFYQPRLVWAGLETLATLSPAERRSGLGEVVKTALLGDAALFARLEQDASRVAAGDPDVLGPIVARCVEIKAEVVAADEREAGRRAVLNAGHTVGHALETALGYGALRHGEAVAIGLVAETAWAVRAGHCEDRDLPDRIARLLTALGLPATLPEASAEALVTAMRLDKKADGGKLGVPVPVRIGRMMLVDLPDAHLADLLQVTR